MAGEDKVDPFRYGRIFLGRDEAKFGKEGTGNIPYDPDFECGGSPGSPGRKCPFQTRIDHTKGLGLIGSQGRLLHVAIASYRDPLCPKTLFNLFTKSKSPQNLRVRVLQQNDPLVDTDCLQEYCRLMMANNILNMPRNDTSSALGCPFSNQIFIHPIHAKDAAGPTYARALLSQDIYLAYKRQQLDTQDHCMSIDSHMDFIDDWDEKMVNMWDITNNEYTVLSTYVASTEQLLKPLNNNEVPLLCMVTFTSNVRNHATKCADGLVKPKLTNAIWGAGLSFSKCHAELKVPVDPHTPMIFDGEEFNRAARFWTYGYDIYTPHRVYVFHDYTKSQSNPIMHTWYQNKPVVSFAEANKRLLTMIDVPGGETDPQKVLRMKQSRYGLGDRRTLDQLIQFSGIDLRNARDTIDGKNRCGNLKWVPFVEHPKGVNYIPSFDPTTEDPLDLPYDPSSIWFTGPTTLDVPLRMKIGLPSKSKVNTDKERGALSKKSKIKELRQVAVPVSAKKLPDNSLTQHDGRRFARKDNSLRDKHAHLLHELKQDTKAKLEKVDPIISNAESVFAAKQDRKHGELLRPKLNIPNDFLVDHAQLDSTNQGMWFLPFPVQLSIFLLLSGLVASIFYGRKKQPRGLYPLRRGQSKVV